MKTLQLFNCVIASQEPQEARYNLKHGIVVGPYAAHAYEAIIRWYNQNVPTGEDLNKAFFKSWKDAESVSLIERLVLQLTHYFTTYGMEALGLDCEEAFIFTPQLRDGQRAPDLVTFKVIKAARPEEIIERCFGLLNKAALKRETIDDIFECLTECNYSLTGKEQVSNKEAKILIYQKTGTMPSNGDELFRYLINLATEETLVIKNDALINKIKQSNYRLSLNKEQRRELAKSFNRYKPLWLAFKASHFDNPGVVNEISRLSKTLHQPRPKDYLGTVTSAIHNQEELDTAAMSAPIPVLLRAMNACKAYMEEDKTSRAYRVRNGKLHTREKPISLPRAGIVINYVRLQSAAAKRLGNRKVYIPNHINYAMPTSEKNFLGNYPTGTSIEIPKGEERLLIGIYWEDQGQRVDIDLSGTELGGKVGWNSSWNDGGLVYSGDVTSAPKGAAEWLSTDNLQHSYLIQVNNYSGPKETKFKLLIGYGSKPDKNYMIDPNKLIFSADCSFTEGQSQLVLGMLRPTETGAVMHLTSGSIGNSRVSSGGEKELCARRALINSLPNMVKVSDLFEVVNDPADADIDLSPENISKDTLLQLLK